MNWDGKSQNKALLKEIPHHIDLADGDTVYTSGYSSMFPADIPLGITGASKIVNGATYEIEISLFEDMSSLRYAIIVDNLDDDEIETLEAQKQ
jgi:rod shape-determining protein MreC